MITMALPQDSVERLGGAASSGREAVDALYAALVRDHHRSIYNYLVRLLGDTLLAEDVAQDAFLSAYRALPRLPGDANHRAWLYRIATNAATDEIRRRRRRPAEWLGLSPTLRAAAPTEDQRIGRLAVEDALQRLRPHHRAVLMLFEFAGLSAQEVGQALRIRPEAARKRRQRAREALLAVLDGSS